MEILEFRWYHGYEFALSKLLLRVFFYRCVCIIMYIYTERKDEENEF